MSETHSENPESSTRSGKWLTVSQAAAMLGRSERTIQRQCKSGKLTAKLETAADGVQWLVAREVPPFAPDSDDTVTTPVTTARHAQSAPVTTEKHESGGSVPTSDAIDDVTARVLESREELVSELRDQVKFLRASLEARDRDAAELRAALREALKAMPKAITEGESSTRNDGETSRDNTPQAPINVTTGKQSQDEKNAAQNNARREMRPLWKVILGVR